MTDTKVLFLPTIPGNGNYFMQELLNAYIRRDGAHRVVLFHLCDIFDDEHSVWNSGSDYSLVHTHFKYDNTPTMIWFQPLQRVVEWIEKSDHTLTPIRDPVRALLTAKISGYIGGNGNYIVDLYEIVADWYEKYAISVLPIDLLAEREFDVRCEVVDNFMHPIDVGGGHHLDFLRKWSVFNHRVNSRTSEYRQQTPNAEDDIRLLYPSNMKAVSEVLPAYDYLLKKKDKLQPFLEAVGYNNLPWW